MLWDMDLAISLPGRIEILAWIEPGAYAVLLVLLDDDPRRPTLLARLLGLPEGLAGGDSLGLRLGV